MEALLLDNKIEIYKQKLQQLDAQVDRLPVHERAKYKATRRRYQKRLKAWQQTLGSDLAIFDSNITNEYHELENRFTTNKV